MNGRALAVLLALGCAAACNQADPTDDDSVDAGAGRAGGGAGSGGSGGDADAGAAGEGGTGGSASGFDYYPLSDGASWRYLHSSGGGWEETISVAALTAADTFLVTSSPDLGGISAESTMRVADDEVSRVAEDTLLEGVLEQTVTYDPGFLRFSSGWADADVGFSERRVYQRTETKAGGTPKAPSERAHVYTVEALAEDVSVPAGSFRNCLRVHRKRDYEVTDATGATVSEEQEKRYWFCPGVGKVREENVMSGSTESLMEYDL